MAQSTHDRIYLKPALLSLEVDNEGKDFNSFINEAAFRINLEPADELVELFDRRNFSRRGKFTWSKHMSDETVTDFVRFVQEYSETFTPYTLYSHEKKAFENPINSFIYRRSYRDTTDSYSQPLLFNMAGNIYGVQSPFAVGIGNIYPLFDSKNPRQEETSGHRRLNDAYSELRRNYMNNADRMRSLSDSLMYTPENVKAEFSPGRLYMYIKRNVVYVTMKAAGNLVGFENVEHNDQDFIELMASMVKKINAPAPRTYVTENYLSRWEVMEAITNINEHILSPNVWDENKSQEAYSFLEKADDMVTVGYTPGKPAQAVIMRGKNVPTLASLRIAPEKPRDMSLTRILNVQKSNPDTEFIIHPSLMDIVKMSEAKSFMKDSRLHKYQKTAVGLHLSTDIGYLNASDPGLGKSMMQLSSMRERAKNVDFYRGIITCEANVRHQWAEYAGEWFPEAEVCVLSKASETNKLLEALSSMNPVIIVTSYSLAAHAFSYKELQDARAEQFAGLTLEQKRDFFVGQDEEDLTIGELLHNTHWNDICADEAVCIRNGSSKQAKAMWILRQNSDVAVALTGTPVNKGADDMAKLLEWIRNDKRLFQGHKLSVEYDTETLAGAKKLFDDLTPLIFRRERNEVKADMKKSGKPQEIPQMKNPVSIVLEPHPAEKALAYAAEKELKRVYLELMSALEAVEDKDGSEDLKEAKEQLRNAHGQWMGGTQLARMATSDPSSLLKSDSMGANLLVGQGLVSNALEQEPTKRTEFIKRAHGHIEKGQSILVFTEFATVADSLVAALEENGIRAGAFTGKNLTKREKHRKDFQEGNLDVLVCTKAGERGLTLHKASAIYHYDMPWTIERLTQRIGRALRVGSENQEVEIYFMLLGGTVEERVAAQVLSQGTSASMILDASRGVDVSKTGLGSTMAGLMSTTASLSSRKGALEFGKALNLV